jgi:hypothetical protein
MPEGHSSTTATAAGKAAALTVDGPTLRRVLRGRPPFWRARVAADLVRGQIVVSALTPSQAARLCIVHVGNVSVALGTRGSRGPRDKTIDKVVRRFGVEPLMRGLDRATAPQRVAAE